ncbi:uncharacterized protein BT62DRAFT_1008870 [Guyanagaster necrorhizus]|uniref:Uncharacterized protein n=1 Tax=Guyanagaster necrorhizus TaxID=856835 RepID=A0A9P7VM78_9AGAR|nr:uncharacterized protein BT62DRAFT_1008870 [Guyanagaster necrorhizus MCA 3950]KAG7443788.1 hypothetical protein BT62DRAFT_1008870 [Guyanagaster necrorhizus MCA 3950]
MFVTRATLQEVAKGEVFKPNTTTTLCAFKFNYQDLTNGGKSLTKRPNMAARRAGYCFIMSLTSKQVILEGSKRETISTAFDAKCDMGFTLFLPLPDSLCIGPLTAVKKLKMESRRSPVQWKSTLKSHSLEPCPASLPSGSKKVVLVSFDHLLIDGMFPRVAQASELFQEHSQARMARSRWHNAALKGSFSVIRGTTTRVWDDVGCIHLSELMLCPDQTLLQGSRRSQIVGAAVESLVRLDMSCAYGVVGQKPGLNPPKFIPIPQVGNAPRLQRPPPPGRSLYLNGQAAFTSVSHREMITISLMIDSRYCDIGAIAPIEFGKHWIAILQSPWADAQFPLLPL